MSEQSYDIIGDIHGHADALRRLLVEMAYTEVRGVFRHPERKAIFVGDFIDRGPDQREVLRISRKMCEAGSAMAVLGNHEFNALAWATPDGQGGFLRSHSDHHRDQHAEFLRQLGEGSADHLDALNWFQGLPLWLELPSLRVIHACWHEPSMNLLRPCLDNQHRLTGDGFRESLTRGSDAYAAAEILLKGPEQRLPAGITFLDKDGYKRHEVRIRWWDNNATTFRRAAIGFDDRLADLPDTELPVDFRYATDVPVFFGHYWMNGTPALTAPNAACLDFSVAKQGYLTAYRWSGGRALSPNNLLYVPAEG